MTHRNVTSLVFPLLFLVLIVAILYWARVILMPVAFAVLLAFLINPLVNGFQKLRLGRTPAVLLAVLLVTGFLGVLGWATLRQLQALAHEIPQHRDTIIRKVASLHRTGSGMTGSLVELIKDVGDELETGSPFKPHNNNGTEEPVPVVVQQPNTPSSLSWFSMLAEPAVEILAKVVLVFGLVIFMLIYREDLRNRLIQLAGTQRLSSTTRAIDESSQRIGRYLILQLLVNSCFALALSLGLWILHVPHALFWGIFGGLLRYVPYVGTWLAATVLMVFTLAVFPGWTEPLLTFGLFLLLELPTSNFVEPLLFGKGTGVSPVGVFVAAAFWTWLWGPTGLILATPITVCFVVLGKYIPQLEALTVLLSSERGLETDVSFYQRLLAHDQDEATNLVETFVQNHPAESVFDEILVPALVLAKHDRRNGELSRPDEEHILGVTRQILEDIIIPTSSVPAAGEDQEPTVALYGCAAEDAFDELGLTMFHQLLGPSPWPMQMISANALVGETVTQLPPGRRAVVVIAALPPGGIARSRYLCKRLRNNPNVQVLVGCWGLTDEVQDTRQRLLSAGANHIGTSLIETREQLKPLLQALSRVKPLHEVAAAR
ncbi:MAG TPA: AI-2E family transporter [Gemmataceae bacterium]|nr:AI-2E family transporter [Gemmataceae bacterium]